MQASDFLQAASDLSRAEHSAARLLRGVIRFEALDTKLRPDGWGFDYEGRIYAPPLIPMADVSRALDELEWAIDEGARTRLW